jgi:hypothetical protein
MEPATSALSKFAFEFLVNSLRLCVSAVNQSAHRRAAKAPRMASIPSAPSVLSGTDFEFPLNSLRLCVSAVNNALEVRP